ncbi:uncharacterized protein STEHIDRAFT_45655, partial [Stereum hirsutum FP-91666 SS1]|uniref:uncharacterized protein n=1 Tax=Stereum hirsutum (strain FP-91666) TaxID=721885 RepID=UPI000440D021
IFKELVSWRLLMWETEWRSVFVDMGPRGLISDADLLAIASKANAIEELEDLENIVQIYYWDEVAPRLLMAV